MHCRGSPAEFQRERPPRRYRSVCAAAREAVAVARARRASNCFSFAARASPPSITGFDGGYFSAASRSAITGNAFSNARVKECVVRSASWKYARPKYVHSASLLQPKELRSCAAG